MLKEMKNEGGSITIETTISLSAFMFAIITILTILNICIVQARISYAINTTAEEISQYSYLYSLTGLNDREYEIFRAGQEQTEDLSQILSDVNAVYNEIENLGQTGKHTPDNIDDILNAWDGINENIDNIKGAGSSIKNSIENIADDPKNLMFGIAKIATTEGFDLIKSRLIAAPLARAMCKKHLVNEKNGDVNAYLKYYGIVPSATGSYIDGLDFSQSTLFPYGSNEIRINVSYDVKVIALLPIDFSFHFNQTAVTHGWLAGEVNFKGWKEYEENDTIWVRSTVNERAGMIRRKIMQEKEAEGYKRTRGLTDVQLYDPDANKFVMISSMNPLWSAEGEASRTLADLDYAALKRSIERLCGKMKSTTNGLTTVTTGAEKNRYKCSGASNKIILVVPEDAGLKEKVESVIAVADTKGVTIEVIAGYGKGSRSTVVNHEVGGNDK